MNKDPRDSDITYLPQRYKMQIQAKKKKRLLKKIGVLIISITICIVAYFLFSGLISGSPIKTSVQIPNTTFQSGDPVAVLQEGDTTSAQTGNERKGNQADPAIDISTAQKIADRTIIERNGSPLPVTMSDARYIQGSA
ncbi:MAG: hypothetical protein LUQ54_01180, partial [Methanoregula sp.]|nr:hypothetical protein [Methanoregula sp.]